MGSHHSKLADRWVVQAVKLTRWLRAADTAARLSGPQASALAIIVHAERIRPSELAELEEVKRPTIARTIRQLSDLGLIKRKVDSSDARSAFLIATQKGKTLLEEGQKRRIEPLARAFMGLSPGERLTLEKAARIVEGILP